MHISAQRSPRSISAAFLKAVAELGYDIETPNQPEPKGFCETVVNQRRGARWSSADGYLKPALRRKNLTLLTEATATRVLIDRGHAVGVEFSQGGKRRVVRAHREIALCAGAVNTPQLLMLSGVGDRDHLANTASMWSITRPRSARTCSTSRHTPGFRGARGQPVRRGTSTRARELSAAASQHADVQYR